MTNAAELRDIDLTTDSNFVAASKMSGVEERNYKAALNIDGFLQTNRKPPMKYGDVRMALIDGKLSFLKGKRIHGTGWKWGSGLPTKETLSSQINDCVPSAVVLARCPRKVENQNHRLLLLLNSDDGDYVVESSRSIAADKTIVSLNFPVISFTCLAEFYRKPGNKIVPAAWVAIRKLESGKLVVIDYQQQVLVKVNGSIPPGPGFELDSRRLLWKRPAATLLLDKETEQCMLFFGDKAAALSGNVKDINEAFSAIIPKQFVGRKDIVVFDEWIIVPVKAKDVPEKHTCVALGDNADYFSAKLPHAQGETEYYVGSSDIRISSQVFAFDLSLENSSTQEEKTVKGWSVLVKNDSAKIVTADGVVD